MSSGDLPEQEPLKVTPGWAMRRACRPEERLEKAAVYEPPKLPSSEGIPPDLLADSNGVSPNFAAGIPAPRVPEHLRRVSISDVVDTPEPAPPGWDAMRGAVPGDVELRRAGVLSEGERFWVFTSRTPAPPRMRPPLGSDLKPSPRPALARAERPSPTPSPSPGLPILPERVADWGEARFYGVRGTLVAVVLVATGVVIAVGVGVWLSPLDSESDRGRGTVSVEAPARPGALPF